MTVNVYLDTCVLSYESFVDWLSNEAQGVRAFISSVVYMERRRQLLSRRRDPEKLELMLREANIPVVPFYKHMGARASEHMSGQPKVCPVCNNLDWADVMILSNIKDPQTLHVTRNVRDFLPYHPESQIKTPAQIRSMLRWDEYRRNPVSFPLIHSSKASVLNPVLT